ncbi:MAG: homoserine kinase, partial [Chloroflexota bacterium]
MPASQVAVRVPATSANLGPGFDCLGLALDLFLNITCRVGQEAAGVRISVAGAETGDISTGADNPILAALELVYQQAGARPPRGLALSIENGIPLSRGLGSSAAAVAAGLMAGNGLLGEPFTRTELLDLGWRLEGHPDNLAPALLGGITTSAIVHDRVVCVPIASPPELSLALFVPDFAMPTSQARAALPTQVPRTDAVFNV